MDNSSCWPTQGGLRECEGGIEGVSSISAVTQALWAKVELERGPLWGMGA